MRLAAGHRVGPYEILAPLGAGGMGEVYRARDRRLGREVAIKVLPAERLADESRRRRLVQEARAASALNHPNIVTIHEIESSDGIDFIVMEYVPGQTLDGLIPKSGMRLEEALRLSIPIADALAAAHSRGIVHRDLKPANVVVTREGGIKVLDFGLAKLVADETDGGSGTQTTLSSAEALTRSGAITGTAGYMSPEQATGGKVDARSDIFSFGALLYEMVTGRRAFCGKSVSETLAAVVRDQPQAPRALVPGIPEALERLILRCLRKDPGRRFHNMVDVRVELEDVKTESDSQSSAAGVSVTKRRSWGGGLAWAGVAASLLAAVAGAALWHRRPAELPSPTLVQLSTERLAGSGSFSPDGTQIAYASAGDDGTNWDIWLKIVGEAGARRLTTDPGSDAYPAWSPDGTQIAFLRQIGSEFRGQFVSASAAGFVHLVSPLGGAERRLSEFLAMAQISWSPDGRWLAASRARVGNEPPGGIYLISASTGDARAVTFPKPQSFDVCPSFAPDGRALAYASCEGPEASPACDVKVLPLDSELAPQGAARPLTRQRLWTQGLAWTRDGRSIVYGAFERGVWRVREDGGASPERVELAVTGDFPSTSGGRDRLAFRRRAAHGDLYRLDPGGSPVALVHSTFIERNPQHSPDGRRVAFESRPPMQGSEIWLVDADGASPTQLTRGPGRYQGSPSWSPDGHVIAFDSQAENGHIDVWTIGVDGSGLRQITHDPADDVAPSFSRDGRFIYFTSNRTGRLEIWRVAAGGGTEEQVTREGGLLGFESFDGQTLYYQRSYNGALASRPTAGGEERTIRSCLVSGAWAVAPRGVFHEDCSAPDAAASLQRRLRHWDAATGQDRLVAALETDRIDGLSASPDGRSIVYGRRRTTSDLMMIEDFR